MLEALAEWMGYPLTPISAALHRLAPALTTRRSCPMVVMKPGTVEHNARITERARMGSFLRESAAAAQARARPALWLKLEARCQRSEINALITEVL